MDVKLPFARLDPLGSRRAVGSVDCASFTDSAEQLRERLPGEVEDSQHSLSGVLHVLTHPLEEVGALLGIRHSVLDHGFQRSR